MREEFHSKWSDFQPETSNEGTAKTDRSPFVSFGSAPSMYSGPGITDAGGAPVAESVGRGRENAGNGADETDESYDSPGNVAPHSVDRLCPMCWSCLTADGQLCARCLSCVTVFCACQQPVLRMAHEHVFCEACGRWEP